MRRKKVIRRLLACWMMPVLLLSGVMVTPIQNVRADQVQLQPETQKPYNEESCSAGMVQRDMEVLPEGAASGEIFECNGTGYHTRMDLVGYPAEQQQNDAGMESGQETATDAEKPASQKGQVGRQQKNAKASISESDQQRLAFGQALEQEWQDFLDGKSTTVESYSLDDALLLSDVTVNWYNYAKKRKNASVIVFDLSAYQSALSVSSTMTTNELFATLIDWIQAAIASHTSMSVFSTSYFASYEYTDSAQYFTKLYMTSTVENGQYDSVISEYNAALEKVVSASNADGMTQEEKLLQLYSELATAAEYAPDFNENYDIDIWHEGVGTLLEHECVCQAYAITFAHAANALGFDVEFVVSTTHAWNAVKLEDGWYYVDVTWGDPASFNNVLDYVSYQYFLVNKKDFSGMHDLQFSAYQEIEEQEGSSYRDYFPKVAGITKNMSYLDGVWYYSDGYNLCTWNSQTNKQSTLECLSKKAKLSCDVYQNTLFYSNENGLYAYQNGESIQYVCQRIDCMVICGDTAFYTSGGQAYTLELSGAEPLEHPGVPELPDEISILTISGSALSSNDSSHDAEENGVYKYDGYLQTMYYNDWYDELPYFKVTYRVDGEVDASTEVFTFQPFNTNWGGWEQNIVRIEDSIYDESTGEYTAYISIDEVVQSLSEGELRGINISFCNKEPVVMLTGYYQAKEEGSPLPNQFLLQPESGYALTEDGLLTGVSLDSNTVKEVCAAFTNSNLVCKDTAGNVLEEDALVGTGYTISITDGDTVTAQCRVVLSGDVFGDGSVNLKDVSFVAQYCANKKNLTEAQLAAADVFRDDSINVKDISKLARYCAGKATL